jgi:NADH-quinone oxidoreductase subunit C
VNHVVIDRGEWFERARALREEGWWLADLTVLDRLHLGGADPRFEVVVQLLHHTRKERQTLHIPAEGDPPAAPSVTKIWPNARNHEREAYDLFGVNFEGHEDITRILLPDEWEGHPLRKDYGVGKVTVQFVPQPFMQVDAPGQGTSTVDAQTDVDELGQSGTTKDAEERSR